MPAIITTESGGQLDNWDAWWPAIDQRIEQHIEHWWGAAETMEGQQGVLVAGIGEVVGQERADRRRELKAAIEEERRSFDAKLAALEERIDRRRDEAKRNAELVTVLERQLAVLESTASLEARFQEFAERHHAGLEAKDMEVFEAQIKAAIATCERAAAEMRSTTAAIIDEVVSKRVAQATTNIQRSSESKEDFSKNIDVFEAQAKAAIDLRASRC
jgi:hypothetical protein